MKLLSQRHIFPRMSEPSRSDPVWFAYRDRIDDHVTDLQPIIAFDAELIAVLIGCTDRLSSNQGSNQFNNVTVVVKIDSSLYDTIPS